MHEECGFNLYVEGEVIPIETECLLTSQSTSGSTIPRTLFKKRQSDVYNNQNATFAAGNRVGYGYSD